MSSIRLAPRRTFVPRLCGLIFALGAIGLTIPRAAALVVADESGTTVAPADDPGWNYVSTDSRNFVYLGNGWALSAFHVGLPDLESDPSDNFPEDDNSDDELIQFNGGSFKRIKGQSYPIANTTSGWSAVTDLRLIRIDGDPGLAPLKIATQPLTEATPQMNRQVTIIGSGPSRLTNQTRWNSSWQEVESGGSYIGYKTDGVAVKRWGTNEIADEDCLFNNCSNDTNLQGRLQLTLGIGPTDVMSMITQFDLNGLANETQVVGGDSGSSVFYKRNGVWELTGIVNAQYPVAQGQSTSNAVYTGYMVFADLSHYRGQIESVMDLHEDYSVMGDINLDGIVSGNVVSGLPTGDIASFVSGWGYDNETGVGTITSWKNGDLNRDGKTDVADFLLLRPKLPAGAGSWTLESLLAVTPVPEPTSLALLLMASGCLAFSRRRRRC